MTMKETTESGPSAVHAPRDKQGPYDFAGIESKWQRFWEERGTFRTPNPGEPGFDARKPKFYALDMFPYPSGAGLHVGHPLGYCATDIIARYKRMSGFNVLHPMGFDAFGLPAEQYAIEHNVHPADTTRKNIETYRRQLKMFGFSYDWDREIATSEPGYYKFTQWIFLRLFESWFDDDMRWTDASGRAHQGRARPIADFIEAIEAGTWGVDGSLNLVRDKGARDRRDWSVLSPNDQRRAIDRQRLAYVDEIPVNWCPELGTVLANEEVDNEGRSERGGHPVFRRPLRQWMLRITKYAERLLDDLEGLDWPEPIKLMQRNWIGKSTGAEVIFPLATKWTVDGNRWLHRERGISASDVSLDTFPDAVRVYTTRPDTLFGATYMVLAPEHPLVEQIATDDRRAEVSAYVEASRHRSDLERTTDTKVKTGVWTGAYAINPVNGREVPIWVADYVLMGYGTGAIMAVPGSDARDFEFACAFDLDIETVVQPTAAWIAERVDALTKPIDDSATAGFDALTRKHPELGEAIESARTQSRNLAAQTKTKALEQTGLDRLIAHYVQHPKSWGAAFSEPNTVVNSPSKGDEDARIPGGVCSLNGLSTAAAKERITAWLNENHLGRSAVNYKLRDWIFSRQKYWGEPFPVLHDEEGNTIGLRDDELPVELPPMADFKPTPCTGDDCDVPEPPLGRAKKWVQVVRDGRAFRRDLNTMPQWAGSCWYYLRYTDPHNRERFCSAEAQDYWMPVDLYVGGAEHAVLHLLYARFWHKVLFDLGYVSTAEPFQRLFNQGMIQGFAFRDGRGLTVPASRVEERAPDQFVNRETGERVQRVIAKMSKSLKNVVNPDEIIRQYGADTFRLYEMFMGPLDAAKPWNTRDVPGLFKLCQRIWRLVVDEETGALSAALTDAPPDRSALRMLHKTIKRVGDDIEQLKLNTAIAALFDFVNFATPLSERPRAIVEPFVLLLAPFAPHLAEELWARLGHDDTLAYESWPAFDESLARDDEVEIAVQVCGKVRGRVTIPAGSDDDAAQARAMEHENVQAALAGKTIRKVIVVKNRLVNIIAN